MIDALCCCKRLLAATKLKLKFLENVFKSRYMGPNILVNLFSILIKDFRRIYEERIESRNTIVDIQGIFQNV